MIRRKEQKPQSAEWNQSQEKGIPNVQDRFIPEKRPKTLHNETITSDNKIHHVNITVAKLMHQYMLYDLSLYLFQKA